MDVLKSSRDFFVEQKYRFDLGTQFLAYVNFALLIITASDKLQLVLPFRIREMLVIFVPFAGAWAFGYFLDRVVKFPQTQALTAERRSPTWARTQEKLDRIIELLEKER
ncbi:MAG: hypothetical protein GXO65_05755 [Euryarchaeota archaeon]|nr:hypothetical protein [Euryarchaeota archaeon]